MPSFTIINCHKQYKVSYGENIYWKLGSRWFKDTATDLLCVRDKSLVADLEFELTSRLLTIELNVATSQK